MLPLFLFFVPLSAFVSNGRSSVPLVVVRVKTSDISPLLRHSAQVLIFIYTEREKSTTTSLPLYSLSFLLLLMALRLPPPRHS